MGTEEFDVLVIGAGAAGMSAAKELALTGRRVAVIEAKDRTGGRMHTITASGFEKPVELGAEFIHGNLPLTLGLMKEAGIQKLPVGGEVWQSRSGVLSETDDFVPEYATLMKELMKLEADRPVVEFLETVFSDAKHNELRSSVSTYAEGYYAADLSKASAVALREELANGEDVNYRVEGGYQRLVAYLEDRCRAAGVRFFLGEEAESIRWQKHRVEVLTSSSGYAADQLLITVSLGVLQAGRIAFAPALSEKAKVVQRLGFGHVLKINLQFREAFWTNKAFTQAKDVSKSGFLFSDQPIPTWWTQHPMHQRLLVGWHGGPSAQAYSRKTKSEVVADAVQSLAGLFGMDASVVEELLVASEWYNWSDDHHVCGAYSYNVVGGEEAIRQAAAPVEGTIYFAGEGYVWGNNVGTVEAALQSGREVAQRLIADWRYR